MLRNIDSRSSEVENDPGLAEMKRGGQLQLSFDNHMRAFIDGKACSIKKELRDGASENNPSCTNTSCDRTYDYSCSDRSCSKTDQACH
jgi:hypothetical protein